MLNVILSETSTSQSSFVLYVLVLETMIAN